MSIRHASGATQTLYLAARFSGQAAQNLLMAALLLAAGTSTSSALDLSSVFVAIMLPAIAFGPIAGSLADRIGPPRAYVLGAALRLAVAAGALVVLPSYGLVWAAAFAYSAVSQVYTPAELALVRSLRERRSGNAHAWLQAVQYGGQGLGMLVLAPALYLAGGLAGILAGAVAGMVLLVVLAAVVALRLRDVSSAPADGCGRASYGLGSTLAFYARERLASYAVALQAFKTVVSRGVFVALPLYLTHDLGVGNGMLVFLIAPGVLGVAAALVWAGRSLRVEQAGSVMRWSTIGLVTAVFALAALDYGISAMARYSQVPPIVELEASLNTTFVVALPVAFLLGVVLTTSVIAGRVVLTELAPRSEQGRVFAVQEVVSEALVVAPLLLTGVGVTYAGARPVLAVIGAVGVALLVLFELPGSRFSLPAPVVLEAERARL